jgi:hypothetical protein
MTVKETISTQRLVRRDGDSQVRILKEARREGGTVPLHRGFVKGVGAASSR